MAISDSLEGVEITVAVGGVPLKEYTDDQVATKARTTTCYIEAVTGSAFRIQFKIAKKSKFAGDVLDFMVYVDGALVDGFIITENEWSSSNHYTYCEGKLNPDGGLRKFRFASIQRVSDDIAVRKDAKELGHLGTIEVRVKHKKFLRRSWVLKQETTTPKPPKPPRTTASATSRGDRAKKPRAKADTISEKAIKGEAISHSVSFADPEPAAVTRRTPQATEAVASNAGASHQPATQQRAPKKSRETIWKTESVPDVPNPAATFVFKYRSLDALKSLMIIPRTPSPPPLEDVDAASMSVAQIRELQKRAREFRDERKSKTKIKREEDAEEPVARKKPRLAAESTVIDLGGDGGGGTVVSTAAAKVREVIELD